METRMPVKEIMTPDPITVDITTKISEVGKIMVKFDIGSLIIMKRNNPVGILTERDMVKKIILKNVIPDTFNLKDIMTTPLITLDADEDIQKAMDLMLKIHIRRIPIVKNQKLVGLVTESDLISVFMEMENILTDLINMHRERITTTNHEMPEIISMGICEKCGKYSDYLYYFNGTLVCESCKEME